jgi:hypothetical protein
LLALSGLLVAALFWSHHGAQDRAAGSPAAMMPGGVRAAWSAFGMVVRRGAGLGVLAGALAGCAGLGQAPPRPNPNLFPDDYKALLLTRLQTNPYGLVGAREAFVSTPALKPFGAESRYFVCLRVVAPDMRTDKLVVFYAGEINQFIEAPAADCAAAAYQPFPEMTAALGRFGGKK